MSFYEKILSYQLPGPTCHSHVLFLLCTCLNFAPFISRMDFLPGLGRMSLSHPLSQTFLCFRSFSWESLFYTVPSLYCASRLGGVCFDQDFVLTTLREFSSSNSFSPPWFVGCSFILFFLKDLLSSQTWLGCRNGSAYSLACIKKKKIHFYIKRMMNTHTQKSMGPFTTFSVWSPLGSF